MKYHSSWCILDDVKKKKKKKWDHLVVLDKEALFIIRPRFPKISFAMCVASCHTQCLIFLKRKKKIVLILCCIVFQLEILPVTVLPVQADNTKAPYTRVECWAILTGSIKIGCHLACVYVNRSNRSWLLSNEHAGKPAAGRLWISTLSHWLVD